jgi:hypothetical protein
VRAFVCLLVYGAAGIAAPATNPTFYRDVLPVLQDRCLSCHRAGEIGPMEFGTYKQARPWAKAIREAVLSRRMPPWFADPHVGKFANERSLSKREMETLVAWVDTGAAEGNTKDAPAPRQYVEGWNISQPDLVVPIPKPFTVPASGTIDYQYVIVPLNLKEDRWVQMAELRPTARSAVHHIIAFVREPESKWLRGEAEPGVPFVPPKTTADGKPRRDTGGQGSPMLSLYSPGNSPDVMPTGQAKLLRAGSDLVFQMHYTTNGKEAVDQTRLGIVFAKEPPRERVVTTAVDDSRFVIPPGDPNFAVHAKRVLPQGGRLTMLFPHAHVRGKAFEVRLTQPGEQTERLLNVPKYNFNWQLTYKLEKPIELKPGAEIAMTAWFDNSPNNPFNPDPKAEVRWGEQSWEEMAMVFFDLVIPANEDPRKYLYPPRPAQRAAAQ